MSFTYRWSLEQNIRGESTWNLGPVSIYIETHDKLVTMLMLLFYLGNGQGSRILELMTAEHSKASSRLRSIGFYAGYVFSLYKIPQIMPYNKQGVLGGTLSTRIHRNSCIWLPDFYQTSDNYGTASLSRVKISKRNISSVHSSCKFVYLKNR